MEFSINLCFTGLHLRWPPEFGYFLSRQLNITLIHGAPQLLSYSNFRFFMQSWGLVRLTITPGLFGFIDLKHYLEVIFGRSVDLVTENAFKK